MKPLDRVAVALVVVMVLLALVALLLPRQTAPEPPRMEDLLATTQPSDAIRGPYEPWPFSFPKMLPGMVLLENQGKALALTPAQAREMLPRVDAGGRAWRTVRDLEIKMRRVLTPQQDAWMSEHKHEFEISTAGEDLQTFVKTPMPGENLNVQAAIEICGRRAPPSPPKAWTEAAQALVAAPLGLDDYTQHTGQEWLTLFDMGMGLYRLERDKPALGLSPQQAVTLGPLFEAARAPLARVKTEEDAVGGLFREDQVHYIQTHMPDLYQLRTTVFAYSGKSITQDNPYRDIVFFKAVEFLRTRVDANAAGR